MVGWSKQLVCRVNRTQTCFVPQALAIQSLPGYHSTTLKSTLQVYFKIITFVDIIIIIVIIIIIIIIIVIVLDQWRWIGRLTPPSISAPELLTESSIVLPEQMTLTMMMKTLMMIIMTISNHFETVCDQS